MPALPLVKLGYLLVRTVAKPISSSLKKQAKDHPTFRNACIGLAQSYHRLEVRMRRRLAAKNGGGTLEPNSALTEQSVRPLDEQKAIELGADFFGEALVFGVAGILLVMEATRNHRAEMARRQLIEDKFEQLFSDVLQLNERHAELVSQIEALNSK